MSIPRPEHPRPDYMRDTFLNLNGKWSFAFDDENVGRHEKWYSSGKLFEKEILVPFCYQSKASGIGPTDEIHPYLWYRRSFRVPEEMAGKRILLHFGAVDFEATVYVNGQMVGNHRGGYTPFAFDITDVLAEGENDLCVQVVDHPDCTQPRGKQYWKQGLMGCWYTPVSGIWQTVYLEAAGELRMDYVHFTPDIDAGTVSAEVMLNRFPAGTVGVALHITLDGQPVRTVMSTMNERSAKILADLNSGETHQPVLFWQPDRPSLYDVQVELLQGDHVLDRVKTYFGMRKIELRDGAVYLNNHRLYQRLVLDQGYWPDTLLTPPSDEAIQEDLRQTLALGFNGARKHQKVEDPRYYYWADKMGVLVWGEVPSPYVFSDETVDNLAQTLSAFIRRDFNHPCLITWVPLNESWGVGQIVNNTRQQATAKMLYQLTKAADGTRLCSGNDGWEQTETDICALHDYAAEKDVMASHFADRTEVEKHGCDLRACYVNGYTPTGKEAFLVTEYGGIAFSTIGPQGEMGGMETWGYHDKVTDEETFFARYQGVTDAIRELPYNQGYCYTQLTDVMQEINGLLTPERKPKVDVQRFASLNRGPVGRE